MNLGFRSKLFLISIGVVAAVGLASALLVETQLRAWLETSEREQLEARAETVRHAVELYPDASPDAVADRLVDPGDQRLAIFDEDGVLVGDSSRETRELMEAEFATPGIVDIALEEGRMVVETNDDVHTVAVRFDRDDGNGAIVLTRSTERVDDAIGTMRGILLLGGLLGLSIAALMSGVASYLLSRSLQVLVNGARILAFDRGDATYIEIDTADDLGNIAGSLNRLRDQFEGLVATLAAERTRFEDVLEGTDELVLAVDQSRRLLFANSAARDLLAIDEDTSQDRPLIEIVRLPGLHERLRGVLDDREGVSADITVPTSPPRQLLARVTPMSAGGAVIVMHDVTRLRSLERMRRDFVANVSHELRTPVNVVRVNAETLIDGALEDPVHGPRFTEAILRNAIRMSRLIDDLLDIARIEAGRYSVSPEEVDVADLAADVVASLEQHANAQDITLCVHAEGEAWAWADPVALEHVLINLVENGIKYTPAGGRVTVLVSRVDDGERVRIDVTDDGPGIAPQHRARLFERFYRVDAGRSRHQGGTGLGLSIVKHLVRGMEGRVAYHPADPHGSTFRVHLNSAPKDASPDDLALREDRAPNTTPLRVDSGHDHVLAGAEAERDDALRHDPFDPAADAQSSLSPERSRPTAAADGDNGPDRPPTRQ